jgi:hypothetical protein
MLDHSSTEVISDAPIANTPQTQSSPESSKPSPAKRPITNPRAGKRTLKKATTQWIRRAHLFLGLFLFPWAILYGFTGYLFNHPIAFRNPPAVKFGPEVLRGTPFESLPTPESQAKAVVEKLNELHKPATPYKLAGEAKYEGRENALALITREGKEKNVSVSIHVRYLKGLAHYESKRGPAPVEKAPFNVGPPVSGRRVAGAEPAGPPPGRSREANAGIMLEDTIQDRLLKTVPAVLASTGMPSGEISITSVPILVFPVEADGRVWKTSYNQLTGGVSGIPADHSTAIAMDWRRFLLQLHLAHIYSWDYDYKWFWALIVDAMAFTMCFWGLSGLLMWWQIKATRRAGFLTLIASAIVAVVMGFGMHTVLTGG